MKFLLSCLSTQHSLLRKHWADSPRTTKDQPNVLGTRFKPTYDLGGILALVNEQGQVERTLNLPQPAGMIHWKGRVLVATRWAIYNVSPDLTKVREVVSLPTFNALHSLSKTKQGYLIASTGLDLLLELDAWGQVIWSWWADEHGFDKTPLGEPRTIDKDFDHRGLEYGTLTHTTHVNSSAQKSGGSVLASLFHQGTIIEIEPETGQWYSLLGGLDHAHSIRILDDQTFTVADTGRGKALLIHQDGRLARVKSSIHIETTWLQDCTYLPEQDIWVLVDGQNSRLVLRSGLDGSRTLTEYQFDKEWRLYEALILS
ncbi:MAG: hypothetical protein AAF629_11145 [Chloroflexota bacterium]